MIQVLEGGEEGMLEKSQAKLIYICLDAHTVHRAGHKSKAHVSFFCNRLSIPPDQISLPTLQSHILPNSWFLAFPIFDKLSSARSSCRRNHT